MIKQSWTNAENQLLVANYKRGYLKEFSRLTGRSIGSIRVHANRLGLTTRYSCNDFYFSIPSIENSYFAGFIAADGNIGDDHRLTIKIHKKDREILEQLKKSIQFSGPITGPDSQNQVTLRIVSQQICDDLEKNYNITPRKTYTLQPPIQLSDQYVVRSFITGLIDGDGCISQNNKSKMKIVGTYDLLIWIKQLFDSWSPAVRMAVVKDLGTFATYQIAGYRARIVIDKLLQVNVPRFARKWGYYE